MRFDPAKFNWLGNPEVSAQVCVAVAGVPVQKAEDLFEKELLIGGAGLVERQAIAAQGVGQENSAHRERPRRCVMLTPD